MIEIHNLSKQFGKLRVLNHLDLSLSTGKITAILGPNGSGKTTLIKSILGLVRPDSGEILFDGSSIRHRDQYRNKIGYLSQIARFPENLKVMELIRMVQDIRGAKGEAGALIERFDLQPYLNKKLGHLSGGTKQKVNLVLAFMYDVPMYILDEPTSGLDPVALIRLKDLIQEEKSKGKSFLVTTHIMSLVEELADELVFLLEGRIRFQGTYLEMMEAQGERNLERSIAKILEDEHA